MCISILCLVSVAQSCFLINPSVTKQSQTRVSYFQLPTSHFQFSRGCRMCIAEDTLMLTAFDIFCFESRFCSPESFSSNSEHHPPSDFSCESRFCCQFLLHNLFSFQIPLSNPNPFVFNQESFFRAMPDVYCRTIFTEVVCVQSPFF